MVSKRTRARKRSFPEGDVLDDKTTLNQRGPNSTFLMGHSVRAKQLSQTLKNIGFDGNFSKYWWASFNFNQNTCGCSICNEHVELLKPDPVIQCRLRIVDASTTLKKFRQHESSPAHIGVLKKLGMSAGSKRKASHFLKPRKRRKIEKLVRSGTCIRCGYFGEAQICIQETSTAFESNHALTFGRFSDQLLADHLAQECGGKLRDEQVEMQMNKFRVGKYNMYDLITMFSDRPPVVWEGLGIDIGAEQVLSSQFMVSDEPLHLPEIPLGDPSPKLQESILQEDEKEHSEENEFEKKLEKDLRQADEHLGENGATPDRRWIWKAIFHVGLQTEWCVQNIWSKEAYQKELRRMWENDPSTPAPGSLVIMEKEILSCAHRLLLEHLQPTGLLVTNGFPGNYGAEGMYFGFDNDNADEFFGGSDWNGKVFEVTSKGKTGKVMVWKDNTNCQMSCGRWTEAPKKGDWTTEDMIFLANDGELEGLWAAFYRLVLNQARTWITSETPLDTWIGHSVSVWWSSTAKWNRGKITGINADHNELHVDYGDDYDETLRLQETKLRFFNLNADEFWVGEKIDVKWDGEHEWYPATVDTVLPENRIKVKYADNSKEEIACESHCFYFISDRVDRVHEFISRICNAILNKHSLPLVYRVDANDTQRELAQMGAKT